MAEVPSAEQLFQDVAWLKSLATRLANDRDDADDLVQEAWIAAWRRQPDAARPMRAWLTKVVRDLAGMKHRSDRRRAARHALTDDAQVPAAPDELLAQIRLHKRLVELVIELDEPYRSTIIARFVEGRTSASIAQSLGIPAGTVRKRLHEALSRLRAGLDANAGDRKRWAPAVLAFAKGGIHVAKSTKLVLVVLAALLLASVATVMFVLPMRGGSGGTTASTRSAETTASSGAAPAGPSVTIASTDAPTPLQPVSEHRAAERAAMLAAIASAREARDHRTAAPTRTPATPGAHTTTVSDSPATTLDITDRTGDHSEWSKRALGTLNRLLGQCYDLGRAEDANLEGTVTLRFTLVGEPNVGGLLEHVEIVDAETTITQQTIRDCLTQQLYALELDPPPDGVRVTRQLGLNVP
ncbi:MAG: RNA polymerase sigma factor [Kofleriaceae bacterium]|nr:RNA polymerase sigma factor [Kofleriaceae bacterium]